MLGSNLLLIAQSLSLNVKKFKVQNYNPYSK